VPASVLLNFFMPAPDRRAPGAPLPPLCNVITLHLSIARNGHWRQSNSIRTKSGPPARSPLCARSRYSPSAASCRRR
jgi:hypothetical protein